MASRGEGGPLAPDGELRSVDPAGSAPAGAQPVGQAAPDEPWVRFDHWMAAAQTGPDGFYTRGGMAGNAGDFITSPEVGPLFGALVGRWLDDIWVGLSRPDPFEVWEVGAGPGTLARGIARSEPVCAAALDYVLVEPSPQRAGHHGVEEFARRSGIRVRSRPTVPSGRPSAIIANELLDDLPIRVMRPVSPGVASELYVGPDGAVKWWPVPWPPSWPAPAPRWWGPHADTGDAGIGPSAVPASGREAAGESVDPVPGLAEALTVAEAAAQWVRDMLGHLRPAGRLLVFDYGVRTTEELVLRKGGWLRLYAGHRRGRDPLSVPPGAANVTADVPFDQLLPPPIRLDSQADWCARQGIGDLVDEGNRVWERLGMAGGLEAIAARSRASEARTLCDPDGLGGFLVAEWAADGLDRP